MIFLWLHKKHLGEELADIKSDKMALKKEAIKYWLTMLKVFTLLYKQQVLKGC